MPPPGQAEELGGVCVPYLAELEGLHAGAQNLDTILGQDTLVVKLDTQVKGSLATVGKENAVGTLTLEDVGAVLSGNRQIVDLVGEGVVGLDGGDVGVEEDRGDAGLLEGLQGLGACTWWPCQLSQRTFREAP
jgi:hypothetical protein